MAASATGGEVRAVPLRALQSKLDQAGAYLGFHAPSNHPPVRPTSAEAAQ